MFFFSLSGGRSLKFVSNDEIFGDGKSGERIADILAEVELRFHKTISY